MASSIFISFLLSVFLISRVCCGTQVLSTHLPSKHFGHECNALLQFKNSLRINKRISNSACVENGLYDPSSLGTASWKEGSDCCTNWDGIRCDNVTGNVISVNLTCSYLEGNLQSNSSIFSFPHLAELSLGGNHLAGSIPSSICQVSSLEYLDLSYSDLTGTIPQCLGNLSNLKYLFLRGNETGGNRLTGPLPSSICQVSSLTTLNMANNYLTGTILPCLGNLSNLRYLVMRDNHLSGPIPSSICRLSSLKRLDLAYNEVNGTILPCFGNLRYLRYLILKHNHLSGPIPPSLCQVSFLQYLDLSYNDVNGTILPCFGNLSSLELLDLRHNALGGSLPRTLGNCTSLYHLNVGNNEINDTFPFWLPLSLVWLRLSRNHFHGLITLGDAPFSFPSLGVFIIDHNHFHGHLPPDYFHISNISYIDLSANMFEGSLPNPPINSQAYDVSNNRFTGAIPSSFCNIITLVRLAMSSNSLSGEIHRCLITSTNLEILDLWKNSFGGPLPEITSPNNCSLKFVVLSKNHLKGKLPPSWVLCKYLVALDLSGNELEDSFPVWLGALQHLSILILRSNKFYGQITPDQREVHPFPMLQIFDISDNNFNGTLKYISNFNGMMIGNRGGTLTLDTHDMLFGEWATLIYKGVEMMVDEIQEALVIIDVSYNHFRDEIPDFIGNLQLLKGLNLSHNNLQGVIPSSLGNLANLEWLDLSSNKFTGEIPSALTSLTSLAVFNVSMNRLKGEVPQGKQFDTFQNNSYRGNPGLCGPPLSKPCAGKHHPMHPSEPRNEDDADRWMNRWRAVMMGYVTGLVIGISIGYIFIEIRRPPMWLIEMVERWRTRLCRSS